jgi:transcriptional activator of cad operon
MINIADILEITGHAADAIPYLERAYEAMTRVYERQAIRVRPWYAELGAYIGDRHRLLNRPQEAEIWYRRVLSYAPFDKNASIRLATLLQNSGDKSGARHLCEELIARTGPAEDCKSILE